MYYLKLSDKKDPKGVWNNLKKLTNNLYEITFSASDRFAEIKKGFTQVFCCACKKDAYKNHMKRSDKIFLKGFYHMQKELDVVHMLSTI